MFSRCTTRRLSPPQQSLTRVCGCFAKRTWSAWTPTQRMMSACPLRTPPIPKDAPDNRLREAVSGFNRFKESDRSRAESPSEFRIRVESASALRTCPESDCAFGPMADTPGLSPSSPAHVDCDALGGVVACAATLCGAARTPKSPLHKAQTVVHPIDAYDFDSRRIGAPKILGNGIQHLCPAWSPTADDTRRNGGRGFCNSLPAAPGCIEARTNPSSLHL
jgi:hypothetical protein